MLGEEEKNLYDVKLVFISACHSELIGDIFLKANFPVVVAVNSQTQILDDVCQLFAKNFYRHLLEEDFTPNQAFIEA